MLEAIPLWQQPEIVALAKDLLKYLLIGGGILYLLFGIIRPAFRRATETAMEQAEAQTESDAGEGAAGHGAAAQGGAQHQSGNSYDQNLQVAKQLAKDDPKIVATVVKEWVNKE